MNEEKTRITMWGNSKAIVIPSNVANDSTFPFKKEDFEKLVITIINKKLIITKIGEKTK